MIRHAVFFLAATAFIVGCGSPSPAASSNADTPGAAELAVDTVEIVSGVPDRGRDPAVVAIDVGGRGLCSGSLIAPNVVLTARHCVSETSEEVNCPSATAQIQRDRAANTLAAYSGDDIGHLELLGRGVELVLPQGDVLCDQDIALIILDRTVAGIDPLPIQHTKVTKADRVRAIGFGKRGDQEAAGTKLLREHVAVLDVSRAEFVVGEATCQGDSGGPALDEGTGEVVGVVSRGGPSCEGKDTHNIYTQVLPFLDLVEGAIRRGHQLAAGASADAGTSSSAHHKPPTDMGVECSAAADCATGICVKRAASSASSSAGADAVQYCSRSCGHGDRCPTHFHCQARAGQPSVCIQ